MVRSSHLSKQQKGAYLYLGRVLWNRICRLSLLIGKEGNRSMCRLPVPAGFTCTGLSRIGLRCLAYSVGKRRIFRWSAAFLMGHMYQLNKISPTGLALNTVDILGRYLLC